MPEGETNGINFLKSQINHELIKAQDTDLPYMMPNK